MIFVKAGPRVETEAAALSAARHPGVVEMVDVVDGALRTVRVEGRSLAELPHVPAEEVAGVTAAVATTLADLHDLGVVHGGIEASHVLVGDDGRIVLCSLGRGGDPADDVAALGRMATELLAAAPAAAPPAAGRWSPRRRRRPARLGALLAPPARPALESVLAPAVAPDPAQRPAARDLAAAVHQRVAGARLPAATTRPPGIPLPPPPRPATTGSRWRLALAGAAVAGAVVVAVALAGVAGRGAPAGRAASAPVGEGRSADATPPGDLSAPATGGAGAAGDVSATQPVGAATGGAAAAPEARSPRRAPAADAPPDRPVAERVWPAPAVVFADGVLQVEAARYAVGEPGDAVVAGDWACTGERTAALLRPATGEVFAFDGWAREDADVTGRPLGVVEGAAGLRVTDADGDGCDDLEVERPGRPPVPVRVRP